MLHELKGDIKRLCEGAGFNVSGGVNFLVAPRPDTEARLRCEAKGHGSGSGTGSCSLLVVHVVDVVGPGIAKYNPLVAAGGFGLPISLTLA